MAITGLNHINIRAEQPLLDRLRDFYRDALGLEQGHRPDFPADGYWLYAGSLPVLHLYEAAPGQNRPETKRGPIDHFAFDCTDFSTVAETLGQKGIAFSVKHLPGSGNPQIFLFDPAGNRVELQFAPPPADGLDDGA